MKINNKRWIAAIMVFFAAKIVDKYNISLGSGWEDTAFSWALEIVQYGSAILAVLYDKYVNHKTVTLSDVQQEVAAAKEEVQSTPKSYQEMAPYMAEVHEAINDMLEEVKSGRYTDAKKEAIETYLKMYELIKQKGA